VGTSVKTLSRLLELHARHLLPSGASMLDLGVQEIYAKGNEDYIRAFIRYFSDRDRHLKAACAYSEEEIARLADRSYAGELFVATGFKYHSLDIFEGYNTILFDLNIDQPTRDMFGQFDLVTNFGTTEHVINQYQSMRSIHELTKKGGLIYHDLPMSGYYMHGYFSYNPLFFQHLAGANDYEIVMEAYLKGEMASTPQFMRDNGFSDPGFSDVGIEFIFRKTSDQPFRMPLDNRTSLVLRPRVSAGASMPSPVVNHLTLYGIDCFSGWELQRELLSRYRHHIARWFSRKP
jgi:hypothetical protein